ncbi:hypothetical protein F511_42506 [Dorcoceras hygrometricum]|uniref:Uncharacterized protein n=1 Tax=Dorcoceras hygrometricum TaxID=472368 RepID=A0A2Z6ZZT6_9LAMI|nr:hypothetical protein F511_42506 [Dorcoceras hygrometricum]
MGNRTTKCKFRLLPSDLESSTPGDIQALEKVFSPAKKTRSKRPKLVKPISVVPVVVVDLPPPAAKEISRREKSHEIKSVIVDKMWENHMRVFVAENWKNFKRESPRANQNLMTIHFLEAEVREVRQQYRHFRVDAGFPILMPEKSYNEESL